VHALEVEVVKLRQQIEALMEKGNLREQHIDDIKHESMELRKQVTALQGELAEVQEELAAERRRSWWQQLMGK
jgi:peptidoglycan hydrolase CwlO-like protein